MNKLDIIGRISFIVLSILKTIWNATIHIVWGIATIFLLSGLIGYFQINTTVISSLIELAILLIDNWVIFWWVFFIVEFFPELNKSRNKNE